MGTCRREHANAGPASVTRPIRASAPTRAADAHAAGSTEPPFDRAEIMAPQARVRRGGLAVAGVVLVVAGVVIGFVGKRTADGRLARNGFAGVRSARRKARWEARQHVP